MNSYKITNITNLVGKRDSKFNTVVDIEYIDNRIKKTIKLKSGETVYLTVSSLPLSIHRLRVKNLISISEINAVELAKTMDDLKPKTTEKSKTTKRPVVVEKKSESVVKDIKKTISTKKKDTDDKTIDD